MWYGSCHWAQAHTGVELCRHPASNSKSDVPGIVVAPEHGPNLRSRKDAMAPPIRAQRQVCVGASMVLGRCSAYVLFQFAGCVDRSDP